jgi:hypothetical protein
VTGLLKYTAMKISNECNYSSTPLSPSLWLYSPLDLGVCQFLNPIHSRKESFDGRSVRRKGTIYTQSNTNTEKTHTDIHVSTIPALERAKTVYALENAATVIGPLFFLFIHNHLLIREPEFLILLRNLVTHAQTWDTARCPSNSTPLCLREWLDRYLWSEKGRSEWPRSLSPLEHWDRGFESYSRHGCLCSFILCLFCPVCT